MIISLDDMKRFLSCCADIASLRPSMRSIESFLSETAGSKRLPVAVKEVEQAVGFVVWVPRIDEVDIARSVSLFFGPGLIDWKKLEMIGARLVPPILRCGWNWSLPVVPWLRGGAVRLVEALRDLRMADPVSARALMKAVGCSLREAEDFLRDFALTRDWVAVAFPECPAWRSLAEGLGEVFAAGGGLELASSIGLNDVGQAGFDPAELMRQAWSVLDGSSRQALRHALSMVVANRSLSFVGAALSSDLREIGGRLVWALSVEDEIALKKLGEALWHIPAGLPVGVDADVTVMRSLLDGLSGEALDERALGNFMRNVYKKFVDGRRPSISAERLLFSGPVWDGLPGALRAGLKSDTGAVASAARECLLVLWRTICMRNGTELMPLPEDLVRECPMLSDEAIGRVLALPAPQKRLLLTESAVRRQLERGSSDNYPYIRWWNMRSSARPPSSP